MRKILMILMVALGCIAASAQELTVEKVYLDAADLSGQTRMRKDLNGEPCALVKVRLTLPGAVFSGDVVGDVFNNGGEYWVYVIDGTKHLRLNQQLVKPLALYFPDWDINGVQGGAVYVVDLSTPKELWGVAAGGTAQVQPTRQVESFLVLHVTPTNAKVFIGGQEKMVSGGHCSVLLKAGNYPVIVEASGYQTEEFPITIGSEKVERTVSLRSTMATLTVRPATPGAEILLNGSPVGTGSWTGQVMPDSYLVQVRKDGYRPTERRVTLAMNATETLDIPALEAITGDLTVSSNPIGATIEMDGRTYGTTPDVLRSIPVGSHSLRLTLSGYQPGTASVTVSESTTASVDLTLVKKPVYGHTDARHLDLAAERKGKYVYFTEAEWNNVPSSEKFRYVKKGVIISQPSITAPFILALTAEGRKMTWEKAMASGKCLPSKIQGDAIAYDGDNVKTALELFGPPSDNRFWTNESYTQSKAWTVTIGNDGRPQMDKNTELSIREVFPISHTDEKTEKKKSQPISLSSTGEYGHFDARHLDLAAERDGKYVYFTDAEWNNIPSSEKSLYVKKGIVISQPSITAPFILALTEIRKNVTWNEAIASGVNMPTKLQGEAIVKDYDSVKKALKVFGEAGYEGDRGFWTKDAIDYSTNAWFVGSFGHVSCIGKANSGSVRAVAPVPVVSAM